MLIILVNFKKCSRCKNEFPATEEYFYKDKSRKDGFRYICKHCLRNIKRLKNGKRELNINEETTKSTNKSNKDLYKEQYNRNKNKILKQRKEYYERNKIHIQTQHKEYYANNKEIISNRNQIFKKENRERYKVYEQNRESKKNKLESTLTTDEWQSTLDFFQYKDAYTGETLTNITLDHIIPISKDGITSKYNIIPCTKSTNSSKNNTNVIDWYKKQNFYSYERELIILNFMVDNNENFTSIQDIYDLLNKTYYKQ